MSDTSSTPSSSELEQLGARLGTLRAGFVGSSAVGKASSLPDLNSHAVTISISTDQSAKLAQAAQAAQAAGGGPAAGGA